MKSKRANRLKYLGISLSTVLGLALILLQPTIQTSYGQTSPSCPSGTALNTNTDVCEAAPVCSSDGEPLPGVIYHPASDQCVFYVIFGPFCPEGTGFNTSTNICEGAPSCDIGSLYNPLTDVCEFDLFYVPQCPAGTVLNPGTDMCEAEGVPSSAPECPSGAPYSTTLNLCDGSSTSPATCPSGSTLNPGTDKCEITSVCPEGTIFNPALDGCEDIDPVSPALCPAGTALNPVTDLCEVTPSCPTGEEYDPIANVCVVPTPQESTQMLIDQINDSELPHGLKTSLTSILSSAINILNDDNPNNDKAACGKLNAFINKVNAQEGKKISSEQADALRNMAGSILAELGC